ncbi:MAG: BPL-N domain-containing protein [Bacteroidales bacterium]
MKTIYFLLLLCVVSCAQKNSSEQNNLSDKIKVGVFEGDGGAQSCIWETVAAVKLDTGMIVRTITTSDIANNVLDSLDAIIVPGGSGSAQYLNLGEANRNRIVDFVAGGKGAVGICAGAYMFSATPNYACLNLNGEQAIDIEHDNRGHGMSKFTLTPEGKQIFPELASCDTCYVIYYEGPVFEKNPADSVTNIVMAVMESDVHEEGNAPANMTNGKPFYLANEYGKGRVFSSIAHPEATPGMMWMVPRMVRWTLNLPFINYKEAFVKPDLFKKELLMSVTDLQQEATFLKVLIYGAENDKIAALDWLESHHSWDLKRKIQGLLYDASPVVRTRAAQYVANTQYFTFLPDLQAAYNTETDASAKAAQKEALSSMMQ